MPLAQLAYGGAALLHPAHQLRRVRDRQSSLCDRVHSIREMRESPVITLPFPNNESRREGYNSLTAVDYTINNSNILTATMHVADQHIRFDNLGCGLKTKSRLSNRMC